MTSTAANLKITKGDLVARISGRWDGHRDIIIYEVEAAGPKQTRVRSCNGALMTRTLDRDYFTEDNAVIFTREEVDQYLEETRPLLASQNEEGYLALVERTIMFAFHGAQ